MRQLTSLVLPNRLVRQCVDEANAHYPLETGGAFMGYWAQGTVVVTGMIGPGPNARRTRYTFETDQEWQNAQIAKHYARSSRRETYIGDWHTHPNARTGRLSPLDRNVLRAIIECPEARAPFPLMGIMYGRPSTWKFCIWKGELKPRLFWHRVVLEKLSEA